MLETVEEIDDYISFLQAKNKPVPDDVYDRRRQLLAQQSITDEEFIFGTMKANNKFMTDEKERVVREMADRLLTEGPDATQPCLLLGKVQCGKTDTFLSVMGLCFDRGIDIAIVMTKGTTTLASQTLQRLKHDFRFFADSDRLDQKRTVIVKDILEIGRRKERIPGLSDPKYKVILVVKKEVTNLKYLNEVFKRDELARSKRILVCDDEADFASRNYYQRQGKISLLKIAQQIEEFIKLPQYCRYLQITATPYSLYLQPDGSVLLRDGDEASPWLPRYTGLVPIHNAYVGGKHYYDLSKDEDSMYSCIFQPVPEDCIDILSSQNEFYLKSNIHSENLDPLNYAIVSYFVATAVRSIQERKNNHRYRSSCLIHCEVAKDKHEGQSELICETLSSIRKAFTKDGLQDLHVFELERRAYESLMRSNELGDNQGEINVQFPDFADVEAEIFSFLKNDEVAVNVVNSANPVTAMLNDSGQLRLERSLNIFIGGNILDRGITIDNMLCFFYGRDPEKFQMDTVLQHARMYGARTKEDMACTRFFTTEKIFEILEKINSIDAVMYDYLKKNRETVRTNEFTRTMVIGYDKRVAPTARNKYTPSNTKTLRRKQLIYPIGFQTGTAGEISETVAKIDRLIESCDGCKNATADDPFFLMPYETAAQIVSLIASTWRYGAEYENEDVEFDVNEMQTALEHCASYAGGYVYCLQRLDRNMGRERVGEMSRTKTRWADAPAQGTYDITPSRAKAIDRPVLMLLRQNGSSEKGWMGTPFYWPVFMTHEEMPEGIFTINGNKKFRPAKEKIQLTTIGNYPQEHVLVLTMMKEPFLYFVHKGCGQENRDMSERNASLFLKKDDSGSFMRVEETDPDKHYDIRSFNKGIFPFEMKDIRYLHMQNSRDFTGSQCLVELDRDCPWEFSYTQHKDFDMLYDETNDWESVQDDSKADWMVHFNVVRVLESVLTEDDQKLLLEICREEDESEGEDY